MATETQTLLDEAKSHRAANDATPLVADSVNGQTAVCTVPYLNQGLRAWWQRMGAGLEEAARLERMLLDAISTEADATARAHLENQLMNVRTVARIGADMQRVARELQGVYQQWIKTDTDLRTFAATVGYSV